VSTKQANLRLFTHTWFVAHHTFYFLPHCHPMMVYADAKSLAEK
jgi:hypothetical protein